MRTRRHALGQNFLHHQPTILKISTLIEAELTKAATKTLLEIGPGKLALTKELQVISQNRSLPLILVERDRYLESEIHEGAPKAETHFMDAATEKLPLLIQELENSNKTPVFIASNLPYSASSQILARLCEV